MKTIVIALVLLALTRNGPARGERARGSDLGFHPRSCALAQPQQLALAFHTAHESTVTRPQSDVYQEGGEDDFGGAAAGGAVRRCSPPLCLRCTIAFSGSFW
jgi:hypothetical protein